MRWFNEKIESIDGYTYKNIKFIICLIAENLIFILLSGVNIIFSYGYLALFCFCIIEIFLVCLRKNLNMKIWKCSIFWKHKKVLNNYDNFDFFIFFKDTVSKPLIENLENLIRNLNSDDLKQFKNLGYIIVIKEKNKKENIIGFFSTLKRMIVLSSELYRDTEGLKDTFYHEWGHFLDTQNGMFSESYLYKKYYKYRLNKELNIQRKLATKNKYKGFLERCKRTDLEYKYKNSSELFVSEYSKYKQGLILDNRKDFFRFFEKKDLKSMQKWLKENMC